MKEIKEVKEKIKFARLLISFTQCLGNLLIASSIILICFLITVLTNGLIDISTGARLWFSIILGILSALCIAWAILSILIKPPEFRNIIASLEHHHPELKENLMAAWDLSNEDISKYGFSPILVSEIIKRAEENSKKLEIKRVLPFKKVGTRLGYFLLVLVILLGFSVSAPQLFSYGFFRTIYPNKHFPKQTKTFLSVKLPPGEKVARFSDCEISIRASGEIPDKVFIVRNLGNQWAKFEATVDRTQPDLFRFNFIKVSDDIEFFVIGGDYQSPVFKIGVLDIPSIIDIALEYKYPSYTGLEPQRVERNDGNIDALFGTTVTVEATTSKKIVRGQIVINDSTKVEMVVSDNKAKTSFRVMEPGHYEIQVWDNEGLSDINPIRYNINVQADEYPVVQITYPPGNVDLSENMRVPIEIMAEDDFGFSNFFLKYVVVSRDSVVHSEKLPFGLRGKKQVVLSFLWNLDAVNLIPNDIVQYWIEGYDNDAISGPKMGRSRVLAVRFPSIEEIIEEVFNEQKGQENSIDQAIQHQKEISRQMEEVAREIRQKTEQKLTYEQQQEVQRLIEQQKNLANQLEQISAQMNQTIRKIQENKLVADQILEKMMEIQKILEDVLPEELKDALRKLQEAFEKLDPELLRQALKNMQVSQEQLIQRLDQTLELLRRIQVEMKLDELKNLAQRAAELQEKINAGIDEGKSPQELARMENQVKNQTELMEKMADEIVQQMKKFSDMPSEEMEQFSKELGDMQLPSQASEASNQLTKGQCPLAKKTGQRISQALRQAGEKLANIQKNMNQMLQQQLSMDMRRTVQELLYISGQIEDDLTRLSQTSDRSELEFCARRQEQLREALREAINRVVEMGGKTFLLPPAVGSALASSDKAMSQAAQQLTQGFSMRAVPEIQKAMAGINTAADMLISSMNSMCQSSCASGMQQLMQQLQNMCQKQGQINQMTIPLMGACQQPGGLNPSQQAMAAQVAAQQEALRKTLEELRDEFEKHAQLLGKMDGIIEDMKQVESDLRNYDISEKTLKHQERILSRMLSAEKSLHQQDYTEERRSRPGEDITRRSPKTLPDDLGERENIIRQALLEILSEPYPKQYQKVVREYFQALEKAGRQNER